MLFIQLISCNECDAIYTGNTKRKLETRVNEHKQALNKSYIQSHVADHSHQILHDINWNYTKISYSESNKNARGFLEKWQIEKLRQKKYTFNEQTF
jgi:hypothetical protein